MCLCVPEVDESAQQRGLCDRLQVAWSILRLTRVHDLCDLGALNRAGRSVFSAAMRCRDESATRQVMQLLAAACTQLPRMTGTKELPVG